MLSRITAAFLLLAVSGFGEDGKYAVPDPPEARPQQEALDIQDVDESDFANIETPEASAEYLPRLVIYTAPDWCLPCRQLDKEIKRLESLEVDGRPAWAGKIGPGTQYAVQVVDASCDPSPELGMATKAKVKTWPTIIRLNKAGKEEWRYTGTLTAEQLSQYQAGLVYPGKPAAKINAAADGLHTHRCPKCSLSWDHEPATITDHVAAHTCSRCGTAQYEIDHYGPVKE